MTEQERPNIAEILREFEQVLGSERRALVALDLGAIEAAAAKKEALSDILLAHREDFTPKDRQQLVLMELSVRHNLVLLAQAREHIRGTIEIIAGTRLSRQPSRKTTSDGGRLHVRG